ncbi:hypothetical protein ACFSLT_25280 [Novosphingobium resinovorum]
MIRSTAPAPETFGTPQRTMAGDAVVPPRDYAKGTALPDLKNYDTDESGTIYDIAYIGTEDGELTFEQRGYSIGDLARASSAQTMRFPLAQKTIQIADIAIEVIDATPQHLRFRATLASREDGGNDAAFPVSPRHARGNDHDRDLRVGLPTSPSTPCQQERGHTPFPIAHLLARTFAMFRTSTAVRPGRCGARRTHRRKRRMPGSKAR